MCVWKGGGGGGRGFEDSRLHLKRVRPSRKLALRCFCSSAQLATPVDLQVRARASNSFLGAYSKGFKKKLAEEKSHHHMYNMQPFSKRW